MSFTVEIDTSELRRLGLDLAQQLGRACTQVVRKTVNAGAREALAKRTWKDRTGNAKSLTRGVMKIEGPRMAEGECQSLAKYASYLNDGTAPHDIVGNPFLTFLWHGERVSFRYVRHPGTKGDGYMDAARVRMQDFCVAEMELKCEAIAERISKKAEAA